MDVKQHAEGESIQERWLADFLDWYDALELEDGSGALSSNSDSQPYDLVERFLHEFGGDSAVDQHVRQGLLELASDMLPAKHVVADAVTRWLGPPGLGGSVEDRDGQFTPEIFPRSFGDYELVERIGQGGMGVVYRARQKSLGRAVCIKMLPPGLLEPQRMDRFTEESRLAGRLHHPGIVPVFDAGSYNGQPYYVMEFVEGESLAASIARQPLAAREAAASLCEIATAIQFAHDLGVLHCDLKPANVLVDREGRLRVTDFGLARHVDDSATEAGVAGTPSYMAVEQTRGESADRRTDVYALGAILYEMLSGRPPHIGNTAAETMRLAADETPVRVSQLRPGTPRDLETICHKCLEKNPRRRYESAAALRDDLARFLRHEPVLARRIGSSERILRWTHRHPAVAIASTISLLSLIVLFAGGAFALWKTQSALERTRTAERRQRQLAGELAIAKEASEAALYRSLIMQTVRSLETLDVEAARQTLDQIDSLAEFSGSAPLEYRLLHRQAYPGSTTLEQGEFAVRDAGWIEGGRQIVAVVDEEGLAVFNEDGQLKAHTSLGNSIRAFAAHPNQPIAATSDQEGNVQVWNLSPLEMRSQIAELPTLVFQLEWDPSGSDLIALADDGVLWRIAMETGVVTSLGEVPQRPTRFAISPNGAWMAVATQSNELFMLALEEGLVSPASHDKSLAVPVASTEGWIADLSWTVDRRIPAQYHLAAVDERGEAYLWSFDSDVDPGTESFREVMATASGPAGGASLSWHGDQLIIGHAAGLVTAIDVHERSIRWQHPCQPVRRVLVQPGDKRCLLLHEGSRGQAIWDLNELGVGIPVYSTHTPLRSITTGDRGQLTAWRDTDGEINVVASRDPGQRTTISESAVGASALAAHPRRPMLAVTRGSDVIVYHTSTFEPRVHFAEHDSTVWLLAFSHEGRWLASGDGEGRIGLVCVDRPEQSHLLPTLGSEVRALAFSPRQSQLAAVDGEGQFMIWDAETGRGIQEFQLGGVTAHALAYLDDDEIVIGDSAGRVHLIGLGANSPQRTWNAHQGPVWSIAIVGSRIVSSGQDGSICISDSFGNIYHRLPKQSAAVWSLAYDNASGYLWASTVSGRAVRWQTQANPAAIEPR